MVKSKPLTVSTEDDHVVVFNKTTNQAMFNLKLVSNGKMVVMKNSELQEIDSIQEVVEPVKTKKIEKPVVITTPPVVEPVPEAPAAKVNLELFRLINKVTRINYCQGKPVIHLSFTDSVATINNTLNNTTYTLNIVNGVVEIDENDYKAIRNPKHIDETGKPLKLQEVIQKNQPDFKTKRVRSVSKTKTTSEIQNLTKEFKQKLKELKQQEKQELIAKKLKSTSVTLSVEKLQGKVKLLHRLFGEEKITLRITEQFVTIKHRLSPELNCRVKVVDGNIKLSHDQYTALRSPKSFDVDGKQLTLKEYLKTLPKKVRAKKEKVEKKVFTPANIVSIEIEENSIVTMPMQTFIIHLDRLTKQNEATYQVEDDRILISNKMNDTKFQVRIIRLNENKYSKQNKVILLKIDFDALHKRKPNQKKEK